MKKYEVTPELVTGNALIDGEHRQLFDAVNRLMEAFAAGAGSIRIEAAAKFLENYVKQHFAHEEELQIRYGWKEYEQHRRFHEDYKRRLNETLQKMPRDNLELEHMGELNFHAVRLITHIRTMDKRLGAFVSEQLKNNKQN